MSLLEKEMLDFMDKVFGLILLCMLFACKGYQEIQVDILKPAALAVEEKPTRIVFVDREGDHRARAMDVHKLKRVLGLSRKDVVNCFYDGLQDGLQNGARQISLDRIIGLKFEGIENVENPLAYLRSEKREQVGMASHLLSLDYCLFRLEGNRITLDDNLLLHLYRMKDGQVVDTIRSTWTNEDESYVGKDDVDIICSFFYRKGRECAARFVPSWINTDRRIYTSNRWLRMGYYYLRGEQFEQAYQLWKALLRKSSMIAAKAAVNIAWLYEQQGDFDGAIILLESAAKQLKEQGRGRDLLVYIESYIEVLKLRVKDDIKITNQLVNISI